MEVEYLPVYVPSDAEKNDASLYAANLQAVRARAHWACVSECAPIGLMRILMCANWACAFTNAHVCSCLRGSWGSLLRSAPTQTSGFRCALATCVPRILPHWTYGNLNADRGEGGRASHLCRRCRGRRGESGGGDPCASLCI